jgi:hypothetical protein
LVGEFQTDTIWQTIIFAYRNVDDGIAFYGCCDFILTFFRSSIFNFINLNPFSSSHLSSIFNLILFQGLTFLPFSTSILFQALTFSTTST